MYGTAKRSFVADILLDLCKLSDGYFSVLDRVVFLKQSIVPEPQDLTAIVLSKIITRGIVKEADIDLQLSMDITPYQDPLPYYKAKYSGSLVKYKVGLLNPSELPLPGKVLSINGENFGIVRDVEIDSEEILRITSEIPIIEW